MRLHNVSEDGKKAFCTVCEGSGKNAKRTSLGTAKLVSSSRPFKNI